MLFLTYLQNNGECPKLSAIEAPDKVYESFRDPLAASLAHEEYVTSLINAIYAEAMKANDFRTLQFLDWFVKEQGEEEKNANDLLGRFDLFASDIKGLYALDSEMGARTYSAPSPDPVRAALFSVRKPSSRQDSGLEGGFLCNTTPLVGRKCTTRR